MNGIDWFSFHANHSDIVWDFQIAESSETDTTNRAISFFSNMLEWLCDGLRGVIKS
jgi:hypothetical protein